MLVTPAESGRKKAWSWLAIKLCDDGCVQEIEEAPLLFLAGGHRGPHALVVTLTGLAAGSLRYLAIDNAVTKLLFAVIVGWFNIFCKNEAEIVLRHVVAGDL